MNSRMIIRAAVLFVLSFFFFEFAVAQRVISFKDKQGKTLQAEIHEKTGTARRIFGLNLDTRQYGYDRSSLSAETVKELGKRLIDDYEEILKASSKNINLKKVDTDAQWWFVEFEQVVSGIPVYSSEIGFSVDPQGRVITLGATAHPNASITPGPRIPASRALEAAKERFQHDSVIVLLQPEVTILPIENDSAFTYHLAWRVQLLSIQPVKNVTYFISATDAQILSEIDNVRHNSIYGTVRGGYWPVRSTDTPVTTGFATTNVSLRTPLG